MDDSNGTDICRVCRSEGLPDRPLFHPCICTGSIKWVHQECLVQWMKYSRKEYCELCSYRFSFTPIYSPDMPRRLPLRDVAGGLLSSILTAIKYWLHYSLVAVAWLGIVPLTACRTYRCLFSGSVESIITLPLDMLTTRNIPADLFHGCFVITCTLFAFMGMVWLREQIIHGGGPDWLERDQPQQQQHQQQQQQQEPAQEQVVPENQPNLNVPDAVEGQIVADNTNSNFNNYNNNSSNNMNSNNNINNNNNNNNNNNVNSNSNLNNNQNNNNNNNNNNNHDDDGSNDNDILNHDNGNVGYIINNYSSISSNNTINNNSVNDSNNININNNNNNDNDIIGNNNVLFDDNHDNAETEDINIINMVRNIDEINGDLENDDDDNNNNINNNNDNINNRNIINNDDDDNENNHIYNNEPEPAEHFQDPLVEPPRNGPNEGDDLLPVQLDPGPDLPVAGRQPQPAENAQDEGNWNPIEWDRAVDELTWERLLGLDGSLVFLEHVFWVVSLNTLFIVVFAFCPYHFGNFAIIALGLQEKTVGTHFEGLITTLCGYCIIGFGFVVFHSIANFLNFQRSRRVLGLCYVIVKVSLLSVVEIGVLPLLCGWWLDICSLAMFDASLKDRETGFKLAPGTSMFIHWLVGIIYVYYFASFIMLLREVLRPGVLWFIINLNDPDFSPIQELIHLPVIHHVQRLLVSSVVFGTVVLLMLWLPIEILRAVWPSFLPYTVYLQSEAQVNELSLEFLLFQIILPALLEQSQARTWMKSFIHLWCKAVSWLLGIGSYLLSDEEVDNADVNRAENNREGLDGLGRNHAFLPQNNPLGIQPYRRPSWFYARLFALIVALFASLIIVSLVALTLPVWIGRKVLTLWFAEIPAASSTVVIPYGSATGEDIPMRVPELYSAACGTYLCWLTVRAITLLRSWLPQGRAAIFQNIKQWYIWGLKSLLAFSVLLGVIPLLFGLLLELLILVPVRVPIKQTPILFIWQDWALGVLYTKIACAIIMMGPNWSMQRAIVRVYRDGIRNMDLKFILYDIAIPVVSSFGLALAVPYATAHSIIPLLITNVFIKALVVRLLYPCLLITLLGIAVIIFQIRQFKKLYEHIKNDKYLVGKRLVNYDHRKSQKSSSTAQ